MVQKAVEKRSEVDVTRTSVMGAVAVAFTRRKSAPGSWRSAQPRVGGRGLGLGLGASLVRCWSVGVVLGERESSK